MKKVVLVLVLVVVAAAAYFGWKFMQKGFTIEITQQQIQSQIDPKFPIQKNYLLANVTLSDPKVVLKDTSDRVFVGATVTVTVPTQPKGTGSTVMSGKVIYDRDQGAFLLNDMKVEELKIQGVPDKTVAQAREIVSTAGAQVLNRFPIYKLDQSDRAQKLAKGLLKSVDVAGGKLRVTLGL
jgi:hypothetical protein